MACYVRLMRKEDISQVTEIDREAFPTLWPPTNFHHELQNRLAHYIVACDAEKIVNTEASPGSQLVSKIRWFNPEPGNKLPSREYIIGFAGFWIMADEAHLTNIAVRELYRRQGVGELLLISVIDMATELNARIITLEVRASNTAARNLYYKYGFTQVGLRHSYYSDNKEDAILMATENITSASFRAHLNQLKQAHSKKLAQLAR